MVLTSGEMAEYVKNLNRLLRINPNARLVASATHGYALQFDEPVLLTTGLTDFVDNDSGKTKDYYASIVTIASADGSIAHSNAASAILVNQINNSETNALRQNKTIHTVTLDASIIDAIEPQFTGKQKVVNIHFASTSDFPITQAWSFPSPPWNTSAPIGGLP